MGNSYLQWSRTGAVLLLLSGCVYAQSTLGTILGTIRDASGATVGTADVVITNLDQGTSRTVQADSNGNYVDVNEQPAHYSVAVSKSGFQSQVVRDVQLIARQELRVDVTLQVGQTTQRITVEGTAGVVATDTQAISASYDSKKILNLPANTRANGSTSPYALIAALPGVQSDSSNRAGNQSTGNFSIQGGIPSQSEASVDGISTTDVTGNSPLHEAFPSSESIAELRVDGVGNAAEYGQPGEITTISKSGTNDLHGSAFWYHQNRALDATAYGQTEKPQKIGNDYGVSAGGPVMIPKLYDGRNRSFFFGTFEGFKFPRGETIQNTVPTQSMRAGDFSHENYILRDPLTRLPFAGNIIPAARINPIAQAFLKLFPVPNAGDLNTVHDANYISNRSNNYYSNQFDVRGDQYLSSKQSLFGRFTWKNIDQDTPQNLLVPSSTNYERVRLFVVSDNYTFNPALVNEFRFGFSWDDNGSSNPFNGRAFTKALGLQGIGPDFPFNGLSDVSLTGFQGLDADRLDGKSRSRVFQVNDNLSWTKGRHTTKFGFDIRHIEAVTPLGFLSGDNYGQFNFSGLFTGNSFGDFLLGAPKDTAYAIVHSDNDGATKHYAFYAQDSFKATARLTLEYGIRYEYNPSYIDKSGNIGNFDPSVPRSGRVVYPTGKESLLAPGYLQAFDACPAPPANGAPCTPVLSAKQAHLPESLREVPKLRFMPRFGFAFRPFDNGKTVIRGGFGLYNIQVLGSVFYSLTGTLQSDVRQFNNLSGGGVPTFTWPNIKAGGSGIGSSELGTAYFGTANEINFKDPYSMQWNFSVDRDLGWATGLRLSYIGMKTDHLVWAPNLNQMSYSTQYAALRPLSDRPFPNWGVVNTRTTGAVANYHSFQGEISRRLGTGLTFDSTYTFAKNLADNGGPRATSFAGETSGGRAADLYDRHAEYGNVYGTRHHRWITTGVYDLPFGRGRRFGADTNRIVDTIFGGWQVSNIFLWQSGPWMTPYFSDGDPSGTGSGLIGRPQHPDRIGSGIPQHQNRNHWIDPTAFVCPGQPISPVHPACTIGLVPGVDAAPIGRFGNSGVGVIEGPGTVNLSASLGKYFNITERVRIKAEGSFTNVLNHVNLADPELNIANPDFGKITSARFSDFGGYRTGQVAMRLEF
jgi:hypothetical protein